MSLSDEQLLALRLQPAKVGALVAARREAFDPERARRITIADAPATERPSPAAVVREGTTHALQAWPSAGAWRPGDRVIVGIDDTDQARARYLGWLRAIAAEPTPDTTLAPVGSDAAGLHKLWCLTAARLVLPPQVAIEIRHDLVGIRLAQLAIGMGADVVAGPITAERSLPLAGVTRPTETSLSALSTIVRQAGFRPETSTPDPTAATAAAAPRTNEVTP